MLICLSLTTDTSYKPLSLSAFKLKLSRSDRPRLYFFKKTFASATSYFFPLISLGVIVTTCSFFFFIFESIFCFFFCYSRAFMASGVLFSVIKSCEQVLNGWLFLRSFSFVKLYMWSTEMRDWDFRRRASCFSVVESMNWDLKWSGTLFGTSLGSAGVTAKLLQALELSRFPL